MDESVMVIRSEIFNKHFNESKDHIIATNEDKLLRFIEDNHLYIKRNKAELDFSYKQIVSYCVLTSEEYLFLTYRKNSQTENRLHNKYSVGIGGHINSNDNKNSNSVYTGVLRELNEEIEISDSFALRFLGIINNNSSDVNSVHIGICYEICIKDRNCKVREVEKMDGIWIKCTEIKGYYNELEDWSKILLTSIMEIEK